jgi:adenosylhomocysteine nucleosidase
VPLKTVLFIAAEDREFSGIRSLMSARPLNWGLRYACEGDLNGNKILMVADGPGMQLAGAAVDAVRRRVRPDAVVSTGFCGALDPNLSVGDVFVATTVLDPDNHEKYEANMPECGASAATGAVVSVNRVAVSLTDRDALRATGARAVEMEAASVASRARVWEVPFYCVRAVSDRADSDFPMDFNQVRDPAGRFSRSRIVFSAALKPWSRVPFLIELERNCRTAAVRLGEFFANCRF